MASKKALQMLGLLGRRRQSVHTMCRRGWGKVQLGSGYCLSSRLYSDQASSSDRPISRYPVPVRESLDDELQERMAEVEEKSGFLPNVFKALAHRHEEFHAFFEYYDAIMEKERGSLTKAEKEMIVVVTSAANNCLYCVIAHGALHRIYSKRPHVADQLATNWEIADITPREKAIVEFAMEICHSRPIKEEQFDKLEQHGLDREDAWDIGSIAAFFALSNRMAHLLDMRPNNEFYLLGRIPRDKKPK